MAEAMEGMKSAADTFFGLCDDMGLKLDTPKPISSGELERMEMRVTGVSTEAGDFQYFRKQGFLDWTTLDGTAVSMSLAEWSALLRVFPKVVRLLGVEM